MSISLYQKFKIKNVKFDLFSKDNKDFFYELFKSLSSLPFNINDNYDLINDIFAEFKNKLKNDDENITYINLLNKLVKYFNTTWKKFF